MENDIKISEIDKPVLPEKYFRYTETKRFLEYLNKWLEMEKRELIDHFSENGFV